MCRDSPPFSAAPFKAPAEVPLTALIVGGVGVANAVRAFLDAAEAWVESTYVQALSLGDRLDPAQRDEVLDGLQPLSRVVATIEGNVADLAYIEEVSWDDDGYWEVEYRGTDGAEVKVKLDSMTGEPRP